MAQAQSARSVLDATAARMTQSGCIRSQFKATQFRGTTPESETSGTMLVSGRKFQMQTADIITWFDGKTLWSMMPGSEEVNISEPTDDELVAMNPSTFVNLYKKGYNYSLRKSSLRGKPTYEVRLSAKSKKATFSDIYVDVEQSTYNPLCIRARQNGNWVRLSILTFQVNQSSKDADFTFPNKDYPNVEVIDLR
jgi:outer membrane lipoprotein-sorting protein